MLAQNKVVKKTFFEKLDEGARYTYLGLSLADGVTTVLDRTLIGTPEATPGYREIMALLGDGPGFAFALCIEYILIFSLHRAVPWPWKLLPLIIPAYIHCVGCLAHIDILTCSLPGGIDSFVWTNVQFLNSFGQGVTDQASVLHVKLKSFIR
jgi:hypothetical protein